MWTGVFTSIFSRESEEFLVRRVIKTLPTSAHCFWDKTVLTERLYKLFTKAAKLETVEYAGNLFKYIAILLARNLF